MGAVAAYIAGAICLIIGALVSVALRYCWARRQLMKRGIVRSQEQRNGNTAEDTISVDMPWVEPPPPYTDPIGGWFSNPDTPPPPYTQALPEAIMPPVPFFINVSCPPPPLYTEYAQLEVTSQECVNPAT